jgi:hypothetical protein
MALFNILIDIAGRTANLEAALDRVDRRLGEWGKKVQHVIEVVAGGSLLEFGRQVLEAGEQMNKASIKVGVGAEAFSQLTYAAKLSGVGMEALTNDLLKMERSLSLASTGSREQNEALHALGLTYDDLKGKKPEEQFELLADRISKLRDPADRARAEMVLFGRAGGDLAALMEKGAKGIRELREEAERVGQSFSKEQLQALNDANDSIERMEQSFSALATTLTAKVAPALTNFFNRISSVISDDKVAGLRDYINDLREAIARAEEFHYSAPGMGYDTTEAAKRGLEAAEHRLDILQHGRPHRGGGTQDAVDELLNANAPPPGFILDPLNELHATVGKISQLHVDPFTQESAKRLQQLQDFLAGKSAEHSGQSGYPTGTQYNPALLRMQREVDSTLDAAEHAFGETKAKLDALVRDGLISPDAYQQGLAQAKQIFNNTIDLQPILVSARKEVDVFLTRAQERVKDFVGDFKSALAEAAHEGGAFGKNFLKALLTALEDRAIFRAIDAIGSALEKSLNNGRSSGGLLGTILNGLFNGGGYTRGELDSLQPVTPTVSKLPAFATGGSFTVGGSGGVDSQLVAFRASPGESVSVGGGGGMVFAPVYNIDARGATTDLISQLPAVLQANNAQVKADILDTLNRRPPQRRR